MKTHSVISPANIAFIKFWGRSNDELFIPLNSSISMTLSNCLTHTSGKLDENLREDIVEVKFYNEKSYIKLNKEKDIKEANIFSQIKRIRQLSKIKTKIHIKSENSFPADSGIASSASGLSALTAVLLLCYNLTEKFEDKVEFSKQVRLCGSGSAARSIYGGIVELLGGMEHDDSYAVQLFDEKYWDLIDIVCIIDNSQKKISSSKGHVLSQTSDYMTARQKGLPNKINQIKKALKKKDLDKLGIITEAEALSMHAIMMTQVPPLLYWEPGTIAVMKEIIYLRESHGIKSFYTMDAGANVHVITDKINLNKIFPYLKKNKYIKELIINNQCSGTSIVDKHLF